MSFRSPSIAFGRDPALRFQSMKGGIQRTRFNLQHIQRRAANLLADGMTMKGTEEEDAKDEKVQRSLKEIDAVAASHHRLWRQATQSCVACLHKKRLPRDFQPPVATPRQLWIGSAENVDESRGLRHAGRRAMPMPKGNVSKHVQYE
jgi:hypothetical protein